jgi:hypothetical protein
VKRSRSCSYHGEGILSVVFSAVRSHACVPEFDLFVAFKAVHHLLVVRIIQLDGAISAIRCPAEAGKSREKQQGSKHSPQFCRNFQLPRV